MPLFYFPIDDLHMGVSENSVPLNPMVMLIIIPIKWLFHWEYIYFQTNPYGWFWLDSCWIRWLQVDRRTQKLNKQGSEAKEKILAKYQKKTSTRTSPKGDLFCWKIGAGKASKHLGNPRGDWDEMMEHWLNDNDVTTRHGHDGETC